VTTAEDRAWKEARFEEIVGSDSVRARIRAHVSQMAEPGDPPVAVSDVVAARNYLRRCLDNMSVNELAGKSDDEIASLWARGAIGAARYRARHRPARRQHGREQEGKG